MNKKRNVLTRQRSILPSSILWSALSSSLSSIRSSIRSSIPSIPAKVLLSALLLPAALICSLGVAGQEEGSHASKAARSYNEWVSDARKLIQLGKYQEAEVLLDRAIYLDPQAYRAYRWRAFMFEQMGKCQQALADADRAGTLDPRHQSGLCTKLNCFVAVGKYEETIAIANGLAKTYPHLMWIYLARGRSLCALGRYAQAIPDLSIVLEEYANCYAALTPRALAEAGLGNYEAAVKDIESLMKLARQSFRLTVSPSTVMSDDTSFYTTISKNFDRDLKRSGRTPKTLFACALCDFVLKRYAQSVQACTEIIQLNGKSTSPLILRAYANLSQKQIKAARADIERAISLDPDSDDGYVALANLNFLNGSYVQSIDELSQRLKVSPHNVAILVARGRVFADLNKQPEAIADFTRALELNSKRADVFTARAEIYQAMQNFDAAISDFSKAISLQTHCPIEAYKGRAACYCEQHLYQKAIDDLNRLITCSHSAKPFFARSICYEKLGQRKLAAADKVMAEDFESMSLMNAPTQGF
jgi:tetratricopeptide (TPR) repeat protein